MKIYKNFNSLDVGRLEVEVRLATNHFNMHKMESIPC